MNKTRMSVEPPQDIDIAVIETRARAANPGHDDGAWIDSSNVHDDGSGRGAYLSSRINARGETHFASAEFSDLCDHEFWRTARADVLALTAEVKRLRQVMRELQEWMRKWDDA
jgi:hypothetical protein